MMITMPNVPTRFLTTILALPLCALTLASALSGCAQKPNTTAAHKTTLSDHKADVPEIVVSAPRTQDRPRG
jgi:outer membrane lipoprotein-sorting protein